MPQRHPDTRPGRQIPCTTGLQIQVKAKCVGSRPGKVTEATSNVPLLGALSLGNRPSRTTMPEYGTLSRAGRVLNRVCCTVLRVVLLEPGFHRSPRRVCIRATRYTPAFSYLAPGSVHIRALPYLVNRHPRAIRGRPRESDTRHRTGDSTSHVFSDVVRTAISAWIFLSFIMSPLCVADAFGDDEDRRNVTALQTIQGILEFLLRAIAHDQVDTG